MTKEQVIAKWFSVLSGHADFLEALKAQYPDLAPMVDPKIAELRGAADVNFLANGVAVGLAELQNFLQTFKLDPRFKSQDLA